jgi:hypothetical protein
VHLYGHFGLVHLTALGRDVPSAKEIAAGVSRSTRRPVGSLFHGQTGFKTARQVETEAASIRYVAELLGVEIRSGNPMADSAYGAVPRSAGDCDYGRNIGTAVVRPTCTITVNAGHERTEETSLPSRADAFCLALPNPRSFRASHTRRSDGATATPCRLEIRPVSMRDCFVLPVRG